MKNRRFVSGFLVAILMMPTAGIAFGGVVINEIMYHPASPTDTDEWDFIELYNTDASPISLAGWCMDGVDICFPAGAVIQSNGYFLIARNAAAFEAHYGVPANAEFSGTLSNSDDDLALLNNAGIAVDEVFYQDSGLWPPRADGLGPSLERIVPGLNGNTPRNWRVCTTPAGHTAGAANSVLAEAMPPWVTSPAHTENVLPGETIIVTAQVAGADTVELIYRIGFTAETNVPMYDDGLHADGAASDGIWGATIPGQLVNTLVRYRISATGPTGVGAYPRADDTINYDGTVVVDQALSTQLPVFQWFVDPAVFSAALAHFATDEVEPAVFFYNGKLYDNIQFRVRGQTSRTYPKKHWKFYMPQGHDFDAPDLLPIPFDQFNLQSNYTDKSFVREILAYETYRDAGSPSNLAFHVRLHQNGTFFGLYTFIQAMDDDYLTLNNIDENGAWYKAYEDCRMRNLETLPTKYEKDSRHYEGYEDLHALISGLNLVWLDWEHDYLFANVNIPAVINYMAVASIIHNNDHMAKNYQLYRDTEGTGRWEIHPWDLDLTFGRNFGPNGQGVLNDAIWADNDVIEGRPLVSPSHPLFGDAEHQKYDFIFNRFVDSMHKQPLLRQMYYRRLRTLVDRFLATSYYETRIDELAARIAPEAALDRLRPWTQYGTPQTLDQAIATIKNDYLPRRRTHLLTTHRIDGELPEMQSPFPRIVINEVMFRPLGGDDHEFVELHNPTNEAVDISKWRLDGLGLTIPSGTVILPQGYALFVKNDVAFRNHYSATRFVAAQYDGVLSDQGERVALYDANGVLVDALEFEAAAPWPAGAISGGHSLELIDASQETNRIGNWTQSAAPGGTPGLPNSAANTAAPLPKLFVNEVLANNAGALFDEQGESDAWVELYNAGDDPIDLGGMYLSNNYAVPTMWQFPANVVLCGRQWLVAWADGETADGPLHTNFALTPGGGAIGLFRADGALIDYLNYPTAAAADISYGKFPDGAFRKSSLPLATPRAANSSGTSALILNEYNGVSSSKFLKDDGSDVFWGRVVGNGGDWFELVVTRDHLDIRGWQLVVQENVGSLSVTTDVLTFSNHAIWSNLRRGTIITVSEELDDDVSYDPLQGDWWINVRAHNSASGAYITADSFPVSNDNWQLTILDAAGLTVFGPAGEGVTPVSGIGNDEVCKLEEDPSEFISVHSMYNDGTSSTFGAPNRWSGGTITQNFSALRDVLSPCSGAAECNDGDPCTTDSCVSGECQHETLDPCYQMRLRVPGASSGTVVVEPGSMIQVAVDVAGVVDPVIGVQSVLEYDPAWLHPITVIPGDSAGSPWDAADLSPITIDSTGKLIYSCTLPAPGTLADATTAIVYFLIVAGDAQPTTTQLHFSLDCLSQTTLLKTVTNAEIRPTLTASPTLSKEPLATLALDVGFCTACSADQSTLTVALNAAHLGEPVRAATARLAFDPSLLGTPIITTGDGAGSPWDVAVQTHLSIGTGAVDLTYTLPGAASTTAAGTIARLTFPILTAGSTQVTFRPDAAPNITCFTRASDDTSILPVQLNSVPLYLLQTSKGDLNGDALRDGRDISSFVAALLDTDSSTGAEFCAADMDGDGELTLYGDLPMFAECLIEDECVCP